MKGLISRIVCLFKGHDFMRIDKYKWVDGEGWVHYPFDKICKRCYKEEKPYEFNMMCRDCANWGNNDCPNSQYCCAKTERPYFTPKKK